MPVTQLQRQVARAGRRLFVQRLLNCLTWCWAIAQLLATVWFLAQPWLLGETEDWVRWAVGGGILAVATLVGTWFTCRRAPTRIEAALEIDQRFRLKERAVTSLTLASELAATPAGQALVADAEAHVSKVKVRQEFPVRLKWQAVFVPMSAAVLILVAFLYHPVVPSADAARDSDSNMVANAKEIAKLVEDLKKDPKLQLSKEINNPKLDEIEKLRDKILSQKFDPADKDKIREQLQKFVSWEEKLKDRIEDRQAQAERNKAMQDALKNMGKNPKRKFDKDGPGKDLQDAFNKGDLDKAQKELQDLANKLKENQLTPEEQKRLQEQLDELQKQLSDLADLKSLKDALTKGLQSGELSQEDFDRLMAKALDDAELLQGLKEFSGKLGKAIAWGDPVEAAKAFAALAMELQDFDPEGKELQYLLQQCNSLLEAKTAMQQGLGSGPIPGGERQVAKDGDIAGKDARQKGELDSKGQFQITGHQYGGTFTKIPATQVGGAFQQAQQDAPQAIDRQRVPPDAADVLRGYYQNLGGTQKK